MACFTSSIEDHERLWCLYIPELLRRKAFEEVHVTPIVVLELAFMILVIVVYCLHLLIKVVSAW